jgi:hypothetical protein
MRFGWRVLVQGWAWRLMIDALQRVKFDLGGLLQFYRAKSKIFKAVS